MIVNTHPKEIESKNTVELIKKLQHELNEKEAVHISDKTTEEWQKIIKSNEKIVFVGPVFNWGFGYEMDKWLQNACGYGFAYTYTPEGMPKGLLNGKAFDIHLVHGTPEERADAMRKNIRERLETLFAFFDAKCNVRFYTKWIQ